MDTRISVTMKPETDIRAWVQSSGQIGKGGAGIPVLYVGGDPADPTTNAAPLGIVFYGYERADLLAVLDRFATAVEVLREHVIEGRDADVRVGLEGVDEAVLA